MSTIRIKCFILYEKHPLDVMQSDPHPASLPVTAADLSVERRFDNTGLLCVVV